jgi:hypothetical protein
MDKVAKDRGMVQERREIKESTHDRWNSFICAMNCRNHCLDSMGNSQQIKRRLACQNKKSMTRKQEKEKKRSARLQVLILKNTGKEDSIKNTSEVDTITKNLNL